MWVILAFVSALFLGLYEATKKQALQRYSVFEVLWGSIFISMLLFLPVIILSWSGANWLEGTLLAIPRGTWRMHGCVAVKAALVLASWGCGYVGLKHLPITLAAPIDAMRPVPVLLGAFFLFAERPNGYQWAGIFILLWALYLLGKSGRQEGIHFRRNVWVWLVGAGTLLAAVSGLYDKFLMQRLPSVFVQSWFNVYQWGLISAAGLVLYKWGKLPHIMGGWSWTIVGVSVCISAADFAYFYALQDPSAMISVISMIRRGCVVVAFACGVWFFHEKNIRSKLGAMSMLLLGLFFLWLGSK